MGAKADIINGEVLYDSGLDPVIIRRYNAGVTGGRTLDCTDFPDKTISAGHAIIYEESTDTYKPMPVADGKYSALPGSHIYAGILVGSIPADKPFAAIMTVGEVNDKAVKYQFTAEMKEAIIKAFPGIMFTHD